jgi:hypothetical protein
MGFDDCGSARALPLGAHHLLVYFLGDIIVGNDTMLGAQVGVPHNCLQNLLLLGEKQRLVLVLDSVLPQGRLCVLGPRG